MSSLTKAGLGLLLSLTFAASGFAVTDYQAADIPFTRELSDLKASLTPAVNDKLEKITIPTKKIRLRILNPKNDPTIEAVSVMVSRSETGVEAFSRRIAASGKAKELGEILLNKIKKAGATNKDSAKVELNAADLRLINLKMLGRELAKDHHLVSLNAAGLKSSPDVWAELRSQLSFLLSKDQLGKIDRKAATGASLSVDDDLLPPFPRRMAGKYTVYKGPNCFHASLSFYDPQLPKLPEINIKEEEGYHRSMINYDELWRVISNQFYEVDPRHSPLKYGDLMVFFQVPEAAPKTINFKWIRHTSVYLFGPYAYSKGSKSPNSPYSVKTLAEEWGTWQSMMSGLGMRIYRRQASTESNIPQERDDWMY